jgi:hypothetical protein
MQGSYIAQSRRLPARLFRSLYFFYGIHYSPQLKHKRLRTRLHLATDYSPGKPYAQSNSVNPGTFRANIRNASPPSYAFPSGSHTVNYSRARVKFTIGNRSSTPSSSSGNTSILL